MSTNAAVVNTGNEAMPTSYPDLDATSPTDSVIAGDFGTLSAAEQERQRDEWKSELSKTEEEILTLKQVLASKEAHAAGLKRRLGITQWREFSEDMAQGLKNLQESNAYKKTAEGFTAAKTKTASMWSSATASVSASTEMLNLESVHALTKNLGGWSTAFGGLTEKAGTAFGAAKTKMANSFSHQNLSDEAVKEYESSKQMSGATNGSDPVTKQPIAEEK